ncbi:selenoprotein O2 isoform X2 [Sphaeramia orbicularis]|uniref:Selenoprotein O n=1 Tax=Sphaeramia orbicularis TaxID=375764 RepID=A0A672YD68_9TELE|nr:protein adenylyltransferase SelO-1, mitochondrial-like isoform X2 [Sphaeramia orbicularis]
MEASGCASAALERLPFHNTALKKLPVDESEVQGSRTVPGACFSRIRAPQPLTRPTLVSVSRSALALLGLSAQEVQADPLAAEYLSGSRMLPGSEPAAHCYSGHQFGLFAGQLGDGAVMYLGEVEEGAGGRWEVQVKGAGVTPYSRDGDGRKVLRSSIREFLCSEAMAALGIPTTRAASLVTSDLYVNRDPLNSGRRIAERCSVVMRVAPSFIRFGSFEIFLGRDDFSGLQGPSAGRFDIRAQLLDYVIETFYPDIQESSREKRNMAFFREVMMRTAKLVAQWQCVGFCHGVLNTDNMSILGLTLDYGPFGFMDRFDPEFVSNASDKRSRYSYQAQPFVCRWNLVRLAEALGSELSATEAGMILDEFMPTYEAFYLSFMRKKLGLVRKEEPEDNQLISDLLQLMYNTGADFTNTFRLLSRVPWPEENQSERATVGPVVDLILQQCASIEELKVANKPTMEDRELAMILSMAQTNPAMFGMVADRPDVLKQLERMGRLKELLETDQDELKEKQRDDWICWVSRYRRRLAREDDGTSELFLLKKERLNVMNNANPRVVLRNYIAQRAIQAAERGDFSEVNRVLQVLEKPFVETFEMELLNEPNACADQETSTYDHKPPAWAMTICVT